MTIFIVDDEPKIRNGMGKLLSAHPHWQVQTFADAKSALHRLYEGAADVIITDIQMPDASGLDMIEAVRQVNKTVPILILSGYSRFDYAQRAIESGVRKYLTKPTNPVDLIAALEQIERELFIASGTLKAHIQHIYVKCGVHSRKELIALCGGE